MAFNRDVVISEESVKKVLEEALSHVAEASETEIQEYEQIKKWFKVPFTRRKYVMAYLAKLAMMSSRSRYGRDRNDRNDRFSRDRGDRSDRYGRDRMERNSRPSFTERSERAERSPRDREEGEERPRTPRVSIDSSVSTTIFVGIGRNRRVYPRDLVGLLVSVANIDRERIGEIRVLTNYSFIQLYTEDCEKAIQALDGHDYRGRKLSVSYSRQKAEYDGDSFESASDAAMSDPAINTAPIPDNVSNVGHASVTTEEEKIAAEQTVFAAQQTVSSSSSYDDADCKPYAETADDGQVKSHFGNGAAY